MWTHESIVEFFDEIENNLNHTEDQLHYGRMLEPIEFFGISFGDGKVLLFSLMLLMYFLFALFFAGIPRRRYWGMIFLGVSVFLVNLIVHLMMISKSLFQVMRFHEEYPLPFRIRVESLFQQWEMLIPFRLNSEEFLLVYGLSAWCLLCFTLLGVSGLWVFRKKG